MGLNFVVLMDIYVDSYPWKYNPIYNQYFTEKIFSVASLIAW